MAYCLSETAASVWERCDGQRSVDEIERDLGLEPAVAARAFQELDEHGLLTDRPPARERVYSRRQAAAKLAKAGSMTMGASLIYSISIPSASAAASGGTCPQGRGCSGAGGAGSAKRMADASCTAVMGCTQCGCTENSVLGDFFDCVGTCV